MAGDWDSTFRNLEFHQQVFVGRRLWFGVLGVELVFNAVAGFSGGVSCPSEVRVFTVLWEQGEAVLFSVADFFCCHCRSVWQLVRLNLVPLPFPTDSHEALLGPMTSPVSSRWALTSTRSIPSVIPLFRSGCQRVSLVLCWTGCIPFSVWWLSAVLAFGCPLEPVHGVACWNQELLGFLRSFLRPSFVCSRPFAPSLATAECSLFVGMRECQDGGLCQDEGSSGREFLSSVHLPCQNHCEFQNMLVWVDYSKLRRFVTSLSRLQGSH